MKRLPVVLAIIAILSACSKPQPVPRRAAYPRPQLLDTAMLAVDAPLHFLVNAQAVVEQGRADWLTVVYDVYGAKMFVTFTPTTPLQVEQVKENRMERLLLNSGEQMSNHSEFTNAAGYNILVSYSEGAATPLQFLATDDSSMVVSGAVYFSNPKTTESVDSITPVIEALRGDIMRAMLNLKPLNK